MTTLDSSPRLVEINSSAPDATLTDTEGQSIQLSEFWSAKPTVLVFLRHLGCTFCREHVAALKRDYAQFQALGAEVVCIAQGDPKTGKAFAIFFDLPFPLLMCGDDLSVYQAYGLGRGTTGQLFGLRSFTRGFAATLQGHFVGKLVGDGFQMPGVFIVETSGSVRFVHRHKDAPDNPSNANVLQALQTLQGDCI